MNSFSLIHLRRPYSLTSKKADTYEQAVTNPPYPPPPLNIAAKKREGTSMGNRIPRRGKRERTHIQPQTTKKRKRKNKE